MTDRIEAELSMDPQHGPIVTVVLEGRRVSIYLIHETGTVLEKNGSQYGIEVKGPWWKFRQLVESPMLGDGAQWQSVIKFHEEKTVPERDRLLVLATKWCDKTHHDWQEILRIAGPSDGRLYETVSA
jgi:hypothetical protein